MENIFMSKYFITFLVLLVASLLYGYKLYKVNKAKGRKAMLDTAQNDAERLALFLMLKAEKMYGQDAGKDKFNYVVKKFYPLVPDPLKVLWSETDIVDWLQKIYEKFKKVIEEEVEEEEDLE